MEFESKGATYQNLKVKDDFFANDEVLNFYGANNNANTGHEKSNRVS